LTDKQRSILGEKQEILECIIGHRLDDAAFLMASRKVTLEAGVVSQAPQIYFLTLIRHVQECFKITSDNITNWLSRAKSLQDVGDDSPGCASISSALSLSPGDIVWLHRRPNINEAGSYLN
jgi:hypothetical protein